MSNEEAVDFSLRPSITNGPAAAAILAASVGCFAIGALQFAADVSKPLNKALVFYKGSGALSGETTVAIVLWLLVWALLARMWGRRTVRMGLVNLVAFSLLLMGGLLTFPPLVDLFGK